MSRRLVAPGFWDDPQVERLSANAKYLFIYLISTPRGNACGVFDITSRVISFHTGLESSEIDSAMHELTEAGRVVRSGDFVWVVNQFKHETNKNNVRVRLQLAYILKRIDDLEFVAKILDKYEAQLSVNHGSVKTQQSLNRGSLEAQRRLSEVVDELRERISKLSAFDGNKIKTQQSLNKGSTEALPRCRGQEHEHVQGHEHEQEQEHGEELENNAGTPDSVVGRMTTLPDDWNGAIPSELVPIVKQCEAAFGPKYNWISPPVFLLQELIEMRNNYPEETILSALKETAKKGGKTLAYTAKILREGQKTRKAPEVAPRKGNFIAQNSKGETRLINSEAELRDDEEVLA